jgi:hypothetical protein
MTATTRDVGLETFTSPNGRQFGVEPWRVNPALLEIVYVDSKGGVVPEVLQGRYTKRSEAERCLKRFLNEFWDISDAASNKAAKKAAVA